MDRDDWGANTDNLAVVDPSRQRVTWVPRDLWCAAVGDRINRAFATGGHELLVKTLAEHGFAVAGSLVLRRGASERFLSELRFTVPVPRPLTFVYPLTPTTLVQDGAKTVSFDPPSATLEGERIHQWLGARKVPTGAGSDLDRIRRQQVALRELIRLGVAFTPLLVDASRVAVVGERTLEVLARVRSDWVFGAVDDVVPRTIDGKAVLVRDHGPAAPLRALRRAVRRRST